MKKTYYIYILRNPNNQEIFYVGVTISPEMRLAAHCEYNHAAKMKFDKKMENGTMKARYILSNKIVPLMEVVDQIEAFSEKRSMVPKEAADLERYWINKLISEGAPITNKVKPQYQEIKFSIGKEIFNPSAKPTFDPY